MKNQTVDLNTNTHGFWMGWVGLPVLCSLPILLVGFLALNRIVPEDFGRTRGSTARMGWYLHSGQLTADFRTLAAAFQFVLDIEPGDTAGIVSPAIQPATVAPGSGPKPPGLMRAVDARG